MKKFWQENKRFVHLFICCNLLLGYASFLTEPTAGAAKATVAAGAAAKIAVKITAKTPASTPDKVAPVTPDPNDPLHLEAKSAILMDAATGQILYETNADVPYPPASMAKMMTEYLVLEAIKSGKVKWDDIVTTTDRAASTIGSGQMLAAGEKLTLRDMFSAMSIISANDASIALAEFIAGSEESYAKMANEKAKEFGLSKDAHFINATGLSRADMGGTAPQSIDGETILSAKDAAIIAYHILKDHKDEILPYTSTLSKKLRPKDKAPMVNLDWMLVGNTKKYGYPGLDGMKTGHTNEAGYCFTATAERNGLRVISVVMGTQSEAKRFEQSRIVLDYGFNNFEKQTVLPAKSQVEPLKTVNIKKGVKLLVPLATLDGVEFIVKKGAPLDPLQITAQSVDPSKLIAPIKAGTVLGTATIVYDKIEKQVSLVATEDVEKASWFRLFFRSVSTFFSNLFNGIKKMFK